MPKKNSKIGSDGWRIFLRENLNRQFFFLDIFLRNRMVHLQSLHLHINKLSFQPGQNEWNYMAYGLPLS